MSLARQRQIDLYWELIFYLGSALMAGGNFLFSSEADYRDWGSIAFFAYLGGVLLLLGFLKFRSKTLFSSYKAHFVIASLVAVGALAIPLGSQVFLESTVGGDHIQPEASIIERSGRYLLHGKPIYISPPKKSGTSLLAPPKPLPVNDYFPYLPGMVPFGIPSSTHIAKEARDARVYFFLFLAIVGSLSLYFLRLNKHLLLWMFLFLFCAPFITLPLSTGGDDVVVVAMLLACCAAIFKSRPLLAGVLLGLAATLKFTAWPLIFFLLIVSKNKQGRPARLITAIVAFLTTLPILLPVVISEPYGFITNVIRFPLGLAGTPSPATSPLVGKLLTEWFPSIHTEISIVMILITLTIVGFSSILLPPKTLPRALLITAIGLTAYIILAPTTRYGYFLYPLEFYLWAYVFYKASFQEPDGSSKISVTSVSAEAEGPVG